MGGGGSTQSSFGEGAELQKFLSLSKVFPFKGFHSFLKVLDEGMRGV